MSLNSTPSSERLHIGFFGCTNAGKSTIVNNLTRQSISIVSSVPGTTTDPVTKAMELLPLGPIVIIDTPGYDDSSELGKKRISRTFDTLSKIDCAVVVYDASIGIQNADEEFIALLKKKSIPFVICANKTDLLYDKSTLPNEVIKITCNKTDGIENLKQKLIELLNSNQKEKTILGDLIKKGDIVVLVTPIDESAPKGRMILPQVQTLRDILDNDCIVLTTKETDLERTLNSLKEPPSLVVTDSQAFEFVAKIVPPEIPLTSFSMLFARYKGNFDELKSATDMLDKIQDGDKILISEGCTHHRQCGDIGTVKLPAWIKDYSGKQPIFEFSSGTEFPDNISQYSLIIHCGACMLNEKQMHARIEKAKLCGVPMVNYGMAIAKMKGIFERTVKIFEGKANE